LIAVPSVFLAALLIFLSNSGNAIAGTAVMLLLITAFWLSGRFNLYVRIGMLLFTLLLIGVALVVLPDVLAMIADFRQNVLKKDGTLTGRTHLWEVASNLVAERPLLGHGYYAFWRHGNVEAEALWRWGGIANRSGFNFHNAFVDMLVDLGWVGTGLLVATCAGIAMAGIYALIIRPSTAAAFFLAFILWSFIKSYTETGLIAPFSLVTVLLVATGVYAVTGSGAVDAVGNHDRRRGRKGRSHVMETRITSAIRSS
jgi:exopolysaccharide production protein ExoQ